jgi:spermidine synthase
MADEFIYHEALVHPGMLATAEPPTSALVIGGGEGATLREILRYPSIQRAVMVDIDAEVVEMCRRHLPEMHRGAFADRRTEVRHEDARAYLERATERFDFICIDLVEPLEEGPACLLFTREFYELVRDRLTPGGSMTMQAGMTKVGELAFFTSILRTLRDVFPVVAGYQTFISCFGTPWGFITATRQIDPTQLSPQRVDELVAERGVSGLEYWDGVTHQHAFALPKFIRKAIAAQTRVSTDAHPLLLV